MWYVFQGLIIFGVYAANIYYAVTPNNYLVGLVAFGVAFALTKAIIALQPDHSANRSTAEIAGRATRPSAD